MQQEQTPFWQLTGDGNLEADDVCLLCLHQARDCLRILGERDLVCQRFWPLMVGTTTASTRQLSAASTCLSDVRRLATFHESILTAGPSCLAGRMEALYTTAWHASAQAPATLGWSAVLCTGTLHVAPTFFFYGLLSYHGRDPRLGAICLCDMRGGRRNHEVCLSLGRKNIRLSLASVASPAGHMSGAVLCTGPSCLPRLRRAIPPGSCHGYLLPHRYRNIEDSGQASPSSAAAGAQNRHQDAILICFRTCA